MFESKEFTKSLDEELFDAWLEEGRESKMGYAYMMVVWDMYDEKFKPLYVDKLEKVHQFPDSGREKFVAAYDIYSHSKVF